MADGSEETCPKLKVISRSWVPATPAKVGQTTEPPICTNWQENSPVEANLPESSSFTPLITQEKLCGSVRLPERFPKEAQCQTTACCSSSNLMDAGRGFNDCQARIVNNAYFIRDNWPNVSFCDLLAMEHARGKTATVANAVTNSDCVASSCNSPQFTITYGDSYLQMQGKEGLMGANFEAGLNIPNVSNSVNFIHSRPFYDLKSTPRIINEVGASKSIPSQFQPVTPDQKNIVSAAKDALENKIARVGEKEFLQNKEKFKLIIDVSCAATSTQLQENHKPDKGGEEEVDLIKTPQQKPRRKRHRPKVILEGQRKSTPKSSADKTNIPQETTRVKRKYVRKKGINNPLEGSPDGTDLNKTTPAPTGNSVGKRKYVRRKGINIPEANPDNETSKTPDVKPWRYTRSSCRKSLNFNLDCQARDESSSCCPSSSCNEALQAENFNANDQSRRNEECKQGLVEMLEKSDNGISHECTDSYKNQVWEGCMEIPAQHFQCSSPCTSVYTLKESQFTDQSVYTRGRCQIIFSDVTHDKEADIVQRRMNLSDQRMPKSLNNSICSNTYLNQEGQDEGLKRQEMETTVAVEHSNKNETGACYNSVQKYLPIVSQYADNIGSAPGLHFPAQHQRKTEMGHYTNGKQVLEDLAALGPRERTRKRISKGPTRVRKLASLMEIHKQIPTSQGWEVTTSKTEQGTTKKRAKKSVHINSMGQYISQHPTSILMGQPPLALPWNKSSIDSITEQLNQLDLSANKSLGLVAYHTSYEELQALVPFHGSGVVVPFDGSFDQVRRKRPRPKVELDDETTRVWKLLLENINSEGIDGTDEEKAKWWEEQRSVFKGRADSFIARMHLVQGDRRFSPWKGSVVDSVVGVFLTQNVSDHLSSSAFMSLAARFPLQEKTQPLELHEEKLGPTTGEAEVYNTNQAETSGMNKEISIMLAYGNDIKLIQDFEANSIREVNSVKISVMNVEGLILDDSLRGQSGDTSKHSPVTSHETVTNKSGSLIEDGRNTEDTLSSQNSTSSPIADTTERSSCLYSTSEQEPTAGNKPDRFASQTSCVKLLQIVGTLLSGAYENASDQNQNGQSESMTLNLENGVYSHNSTVPSTPVALSNKSTLSHVPSLGGLPTHCDLSKKASGASSSCKNELYAAETSGLTCESASQESFQSAASVTFQEGAKSRSIYQSEINQMSEVPAESSSLEKIFQIQVLNPVGPENMVDVTGSSSNIDSSRSLEHKEVNSNKDSKHHSGKPTDGPKGKRGRTRKEKETIDWEHLRRQVHTSGTEKARTDNVDSVDWEAVRCADVNEIAQTIKERGMNNMLAERIKDFLNRLVREHGSIDLEWLRNVPPDKAKEYLLSIWGLGLKSVECVRLLTLHHLAFPVDTNVGRIAVRLGWVPLQPLPESLQLHLLELYPVLESIQKYLWPRLCKLDQRTLYELHYQMITFGKVFCTKSKPNCNACPMRAECRHFASAFASARLTLPAPGETSIMNTHENRRGHQSPMARMNNLQLPPPHMNQINSMSVVRNNEPIIEEPASPEPIIEVPATPETSYTQASVCDIECVLSEDPDEIPTIQLNMEEFNHSLQKFMQQNNELQEGNMSQALVALTPDAASIPVPKLKNVSRLRTEHQVYELPDSHPLLQGMGIREPDDPCPYLLAIWTPGETVDSIKPPERTCSSQGFETPCTDASCSSCSSIREASSQTVRGTLLIPCRTAMRGSFPLNGTYFQVNEVFSDHETSLSPMDVPRQWLWNLPRRTVYFGTSIPTIFKGLSTEGIQYCFWRGFVCVRGFDRQTRAPRPLIARLHFPASRLGNGKGKIDEDNH